MTLIRNAAVWSAIVALGACAEPNEAGEANNAAAATQEVDVLPPDESVATATEDLARGAVDPAGAATTLAPNPGTPIPAAMHGRWGLSERACAFERNDTDGLLTITAESIGFHNSVARPARIQSASPTALRGEFSFVTVDGRSWSGPMIWSVEGRQLVRIDSESESRQVYTRC